MPATMFIIYNEQQKKLQRAKLEYDTALQDSRKKEQDFQFLMDENETEHEASLKKAKDDLNKFSANALKYLNKNFNKHELLENLENIFHRY